MNPMDLTYRKTVAAGASGFGLLIALYDTLAGDLRRAAIAERSGDLERRAKEAKHAVQVVGVLENWIDGESGDLAKSLIRFYARLRRQIIEAQSKRSAELLERLMTEVLGMRELWQKMEEKGAYLEPQILPPVVTRLQESRFSAGGFELKRASWSA